jgi:hypothetical protein
VPHSTLRDWMTDAGLWSRVRRSHPTPKRRERRAYVGLLLQFEVAPTTGTRAVVAGRGCVAV